jgi:hypothetical protein
VDAGSALGCPAGPGGGQSSNAELTALLAAATTKWSAAVSGATSAADLELSTGTSAIALGGWNGGDPAPTLAQFQAYASARAAHRAAAAGSARRTSASRAGRS